MEYQTQSMPIMIYDEASDLIYYELCLITPLGPLLSQGSHCKGLGLYTDGKCRLRFAMRLTTLMDYSTI